MKIAKCTAYGALAGLCIGLILSFFIGCDSVCMCAGEWVDSFFGCGDSSCASGCQEYTSDPAVQSCILFSTIIGTVIGVAYGVVQTLQDRNASQKAAELDQSASAKRQRVTWASEVKQKALSVNTTCFKNKVTDKALISTTYKASIQMTEIMNELVKVTEKQGKVDSLAGELSEKGGASV